MWRKVLDLFVKKTNPNGHVVRKKILIVDDNEIDRRIIQRLLVKANYDLIIAEDGEKALQLVKKERPDLILLDCVMPGLSGTDVCQILKKDKEFKNIPVIFLTGMDTPTYVINCYDLGADQYLTKPINSRELISQIDMTLKGVN